MLAVTLFSAALLAATATAAAGGLDLRQARRRSEELMAKRKVGTSYRFAEREATGPRFLNEKTKGVYRLRQALFFLRRWDNNGLTPPQNLPLTVPGFPKSTSTSASRTPAPSP